MTLIVVKLYKNNNMMMKNKKMLAYELLHPDLFTNHSFESINLKYLMQLDDKTISDLFSDELFKINFINRIKHDLFYPQHNLNVLEIAFKFYKKNKKNSPFLNDRDVVLAILNTFNPESDNHIPLNVIKISDYFRILNNKLKNDKQVVSKAINLYSFGANKYKTRNESPAYNYNRKVEYLSKTFSHRTFNEFPAIGAKLADNENFMKYAVFENPNIMSLASNRLKNNINLMTLCALKQNGQEAFLIAGKKLRDNKDFIMTCVENGLCLRLLKNEERSDYDIGLAAISCNGDNILHACDELKKDKKISLFALRNGACLKNLDYIFRDDEEIVTESVRLEHFNLRYASFRLRKDLNFIAKILRLNGDAYMFLENKLRGDKNLAIEAIKSSKNGYMFESLALSLKRDKDFILNVIKLYASENKNALNDTDKVFLDEAILGKHLQNKKYISKIAEIYPPIVKGWRFPGKKIYKKVAAKIVKNTPSFFQYLDTNDERLASIALKQNPKMIFYLGHRLKNKAKFKKMCR